MVILALSAAWRSYEIAATVSAEGLKYHMQHPQVSQYQKTKAYLKATILCKDGEAIGGCLRGHCDILRGCHCRFIVCFTGNQITQLSEA